MSYYDPYQQQPQPYQYSAPPGYQPYGGYGPPPAGRGTNGMAIASLVVSLVGFFVLGGLACPVGAVLGHMARKQIQETGEEGDGLALTGIIVGWVGTGIACLSWGFFIIFFGILGIACFTASSTDLDDPVDPTPTFSVVLDALTTLAAALI